MRPHIRGGLGWPARRAPQRDCVLHRWPLFVLDGRSPAASLRHTVYGHTQIDDNEGHRRKGADEGWALSLEAARNSSGPLFAGLATGDCSGSESIDEDTYVFWHVAMVLQKPCVPVFHVIECDSTDRGEKPGPHAELAVKAMRTNNFH